MPMPLGSLTARSRSSEWCGSDFAKLVIKCRCAEVGILGTTGELTCVGGPQMLPMTTGYGPERR